MNMLDPWMDDKRPRLERMLISVRGMSGTSCVSSVASALGLIRGVARVEVSLHPAQAEIYFDPAKAQPQQFLTAVRVVGFQPEHLQSEALAA